MIVEDVVIKSCEMPLEDKDWKFALASVSAARGYVVAIRSEGHTGYGYAPSYGGYGSYYGGYGYSGYSTAPYNPGPSFGFGFGY